MPAGPQPETQPDNPPIDLETQSRWLAEDHRRQAQYSPDVRTSSSGVGLRSPGPAVLLSARLPRFTSILKEAAGRFQAQTSKAGQLSPAAEWLLDNYYIAAQALREVQLDLPPHYERQLPRLQAGYPRVYALSAEIIQTEKALLDLGRVQRFVKAYQEVLPLTMGELWALPTMLRLGILECLLAAVARLTELAGEAITEIAPILKSSGQLDDQLVVENSIRSLRALVVHDWKRFFENLSLVDFTLRQDPARLYAGMDFETRDLYRKSVEEIANSEQGDELAVARGAVSLARAGVDQLSPHPAPTLHESPGPEGHKDLEGQTDGWDGFRSQPGAHVGQYLLGQGRPALEQAAGYNPNGWRRLERFARSHPTPLYLGSIACLSLGLIMIALVYAAMVRATAAGLLLVFILALVPALTFAVELVNWAVTQVVKPQGKPRMDFSRGLPEECAAIVVIPALLSGPDEIDSLVEQLEQHYLRNPDPGLFFALVTDYIDSPTENQPGDSDLVERARRGIRGLNEKYPQAEPGRFTERRFALLHRGRRWNPSEGVWMGWERKRGKLHELNRLILGARGVSLGNRSLDLMSSFPFSEGDLSFLQHVRYVITLDADTILPRDAAQELIAVLAHPLNRARLKSVGAGECSQEVVSGYTILQPRTDINPSSSGASYFTRIFSGDAGLDLYTRAVSDVYQDLFEEGSYVGKGAYEVESFERSLENCIPENSLLSHDLLEGIHGRTALVTGTVLIEDMPPNYLVHARRQHRWIRGDWQLLPWLFSPRLSTISRWKILDNLRRSLVTCSLLLWFPFGWLVQPFSPGAWTVAGVLVLAIPVLTGFWTTLRRRLNSQPARQTEASLKNSFFRWLLALAFLPYEVQIAASAIVQTLVRLGITHRGLLRWTTSDQVARRLGDRDAHATWQQMVFSSILAIVLVILITLLRPAALAWAAPLLAAWFLAPGIAVWVSQPLPGRREKLDGSQVRELRRLARRTWLFFEQFISPEDQWLPPDHFQEAPLGIVAHRTSPTNIGLTLLSTLGAYDLGYLEALTLSTRLISSLDTLEKLERYRGHFINWYDTRSLDPLHPRYVSTVDSGNLAACLLVLRQGCLEVPGRPVLRWESFEGLLDAIDLLGAVFRELEAPSLRPAISELRNALRSIVQTIQSVKGEPAQWVGMLSDLGSSGNGPVSPRSWSELDRLIVELVENYAQEVGVENWRRLRFYNRGVRQQLKSIQRCIDLLLPWLISFQDLPAPFLDGGLPPRLAEAWQALKVTFLEQPSLSEIPAVCRTGHQVLEQLRDCLKTQDGTDREAAYRWIEDLEEKLDAAALAAERLVIDYQDLERRSNALFQAMDFTFLFDPQRQVFHIGYNVTTGGLDLNYYDLLASEARLASLVAIAKNEAPQSHWLHLGRPFTRVDGRQALISWSATMFEYLMPRLMVRSEPGTLLGQTLEVVADRQIEYGREKNVPWGISESGYYRFDANQFYQYRAFGVPGLGYKRGLADDLVITPHASLLALPLRPRAVLQNMERLKQLGMLGMYGFYEAADFTTARLDLGQEIAIVRSYMTHHQGMIMLSLVNYLQGDAMVQRFQRDPSIQSVELLLLEQIPRDAPIEQPNTDGSPGMRPLRQRNQASPWQVEPRAQHPRANYLSNGHYSILITAAGGGYSAWKDIDLTRWRPDTTLDNWGCWIYVQDLESGAAWSSGLQPTLVNGDGHEVFFSSHLAEFRRQDGSLAQVTEVFVAPEDDVEVRLVTLTNHGDRPQRLRLTSYGEVILAPQVADARHPAFNKLFIESEPLPRGNGLLFRRRPRSKSEEGIYLAHALVTNPGEITAMRPRLETDRGRFLGRSRTTRRPSALEAGSLPGTGSSLDPIYSISQVVYLPPHGTLRLAFLTAAARSAESCRALIDHYSSLGAIQAALEQARALAEIEMNKLEISNPQLKDFQTLLSLLVFPSSAMRASPERLAANQKSQPGLWPFAISGDYPILLVEIGDEQELTLASELLQAHTYWRRRQLMIDLVFLDKQGTSYNQELSSQLYRLFASTESEGWLNRRGGIFLLHADQMGEADRVLLETAARVVLDGARGTLAEHLQHTPALDHKPSRLPPFSPALPDGVDPQPTIPLPRPQGLLHDNGLGGFSPDGNEYCIYLAPGQVTPAPWVNVIANPHFGFLASESGLGASWAENSSENRLSPWENDPVTNEPSEALYLRDEETAIVWSPTPQPAPAPAPYLARHGAGYTIFEHHSHGLRQQLRVFTPPDAPLKILQLQLDNLWDRARRITATYYVEWVLGVSREGSQQYLIPEFNSDPQALLVRNPYNTEFSERVAFVSASNPLHGLTADRTEFLGRLGSLEGPAALKRIGLAGTVEAGLDPCAALQLHIDLQPGASEQIYFVLGQAEDRDAALALARHYQDPQQVQTAWESNTRFWNDLLGAVQVHTPEPAFDLLINRWLLYQTLACRIWGRTAFYQSSGAYGFRDQLQDVMALLHVAPQLAREHLLRAARHQFEAGDVLHWWHSPSGRGVRTRISDDMLWLPYVTAEYVSLTGDNTVLTEKIPFRRAPLLEPGQDERYGQYPETSATYTLFEHCRRAMVKGMTSGPHNLPLMGGGDWNDGMNRVGIDGRGESTWLGWFLYSTLNRFADLCGRRSEQAADYRQRASDLAQAIEQHAWDGEWYLRAFYNDGSPLGSSQNQECQIDSIAQSWGVLSGGGDPQRAARAMQSVSEHLVQRSQRLVLLFTPPFDKTRRDPGYIKGYPPGVRENGGQYTHAALWSAWAFLGVGRIEEGFELFQLLNPILLADASEKAIHYRVEPYVVAADVYGAPPFTGQGGWTWYTGSSSWMYRLGLEGFLGLKKSGDRLEMDPRIPRDWPGFRVTYRSGQATYEFQVQNPRHVNQGVQQVSLNGRALPNKVIPLSRDSGIYTVLIVMG
ncbi:MAG TPA: glucoamylase family protein [Anaerolineales bacterium]|nr:glucoamylase family protein [Anaerolineales bacterium]